MNLLVEINSSKKGAIEERLRNLPSFSDGNHWQNYKDAYELILKDIWEQKAADVELARQVFSWVIFSKDPSNLKVSIIQRALQLYEDERTEVEILQICRGLVTIDKKNKNIGFVHYTAATYFENDDVRQGHFLDAEEHMAKACLECILFANVSADFEHSLFRYASLHWGHHAKPVETSVWQQMEDLTNDSERLQRSFSLVGNTLPWDWIMHIVVDQTHPSDYPYAPLHAAAYFGLERFAVSLMDKGANKQAQDHLGFTPMRWAVVGGALNLVNLLLQRDISVLCPDLGGEETLFWAFGSRNSDRLIPTVSVSGNGQLLIGDIWTFSSRPSFFGCFPSPQESRTKQEILAALVKAIDDVDVPRNRDKRTLLSIAAENWQWNVVALLLERRADLDRMDSFGKTPLLWALHCPRQHTVIRQAHVSDASQLRIGRTTIFEAPDAMELDEDNEAGKNIELNICHLIGSNLECVDEMKRTPLSLAVENRLDAVVAHLLEKRADPNHADNNGLTPLHWACRLPRFNNVAIEQLVCHDRSNVELGAVQEQQSIPRVKMGRHKERFLCGVIRLLLSHGAQRHTLDHSKMTPWSMAFAEGLDYSAHLVWDSEQATESEQAKNPNSLQEKQYTKVLLAMLEHPVQFQLKQVVTNDASVLTIDSETKIEHLVTHDSSHAVVRGNSKIEKIMGGDQSQVRIQGSTAVCDLSAYEQSSVDLRGASKVDKAQADDKACITMDGESIITDFHGYGQSSIDLRGTAKVNKVRADDRASLTIDGESNVSDFCAYGQSSINLTGTSKVDKGRADNKAYAKIEGESVAADICAYGESWVDFRGKSTVHKATTEDKAFITMDGDSVVHWFAAYAESRTSLKGNSQINTVVAENKAEIVVDGASNIGSFKGFGESHTVLKGVTMTGRVRVEDKAAIEIEGYSNTESVVASTASCIAIQGEAKIGDIRVEDDATLGIDGDPEISSLETSGRSRTFIRGRPKFGERAVARDESRFAITSRMDRMEGYGPVQIMDRSRAWFGAGDIPISDLLNRRQAARAFIEHGGDEATPQ
jgi:ankyrin repeat protein